MHLVFAICSFDMQNTRGVFLHGPPGTGKTSLVRLCAHDAGVNFFSINGPEIVTQYYGESEKALHDVFDSATQASPAVVRYFVKIMCFSFSHFVFE
jgi:ATP-dependent 26S proteasome regulatory subunit